MEVYDLYNPRNPSGKPEKYADIAVRAALEELVAAAAVKSAIESKSPSDPSSEK